jgi:hypothetical protein
MEYDKSANIADCHTRQPCANSDIKIINQLDFEDIYDDVMRKNPPTLPYKSKSYFVNRYFNHPSYRYEAFAIQAGGGIESVFVFRNVRHDGASALRIIDGFGDYSKTKSLRDAVQQLLAEKKAEYIDLYCKGINADILVSAGFVPHSADSKIIIPNFFEPFEQINRNVNYACLNPHGKEFIFFKGDGDQDRPNMVR